MTVIFTTIVAPPDTAGRVQLFAGCNNVALTFNSGTTVSRVAGAISPTTSLIAIWQFDSRTQGFLGYSPLPGAPNDYPTVTLLDAAFLCVRESATLTRPER